MITGKNKRRVGAKGRESETVIHICSYLFATIAWDRLTRIHLDMTWNWESWHWTVNTYRTIRTGNHLFEARVIFAAMDRFFVRNDHFGLFVVSVIEQTAMPRSLKHWTIKWLVTVHEFWRLHWRSINFILYSIQTVQSKGFQMSLAWNRFIVNM